MVGPFETVKQFLSLDHEQPTQPIQTNRESDRSTSNPSSGSNAAQLLTSPTKSDTNTPTAMSEFATLSEETVPALTAMKAIVAERVPATPAAVANSDTTAADAAPIPTIADAEVGTLLSTLAPVSVAATKGTNLKDSFAKSNVLQTLAAGREVAADTSITTEADVEASTALTEIVPQKANNNCGPSISFTSSS